MMKVVRSLDRLKEDLSQMLVRQEPDVIFTGRSNANDPGAVGTNHSFDSASNVNKGNTGNTRGGEGSGGGSTGRGEGSGSGKTVGAHLAILR